VHGDLSTVNLAIEGDTLVLLDWGLAAVGPGALDIARFIAGCSSVVDVSREQMIADYREAVGPAYDDVAMQLALLAGLVWLGWNKALDAAEHPDPAVREREAEDLAWWVTRGRATLDAGLL
jgi:aminoglycoside phosphotransferase (APT) family kinase protein